MAIKYDEYLQKKLQEISFNDVFDINELQELQDVLANALQIASVITDLDGKPITKPSNLCRLCGDFVRKSEKEAEKCAYSDFVIGKACQGQKQYKISRCLPLGLMDAAVPIVLGEKHIANWIFGQVRDETQPDEQRLRRKAQELEVDEEAFIQAYNEIVVISEERFENIAKLVLRISRQISEQAYQGCMHKADQEYRELLAEELSQQKKLAEYNSTIDELTQLNNRNYFEKKMEQLDMLGVTPVALIAGDVNHLKLTNDIFGHRNGDMMLRQIAEVMLDEAFDGYIICRCGGDEFNVIIPNANRQDAEWYCRRVRLELSKRFDCCFMPSIAFGVAKKSHPQERLKDMMEFADLKMYKDKMSIKEKENLLDSLKNALLGRGFLTPEYQESAIGMARRFGTFLGWEEPEIKKLTRVVRIQDYGMIALNSHVFAARLDEKPSLEIFREISKHPMAGSKIAKLEEGYEPLSDYVLAHEERWDGKGYPNEKKGEEIPLMSRISKIVGDYNIYIAAPPIGYGMSKQEASQKMDEGSGSLFDPSYILKFQEFLKQDTGVLKKR